MSLYGMMRTGVSGMNAQANRLSTVADNIANAGTTGYKRSSTEFSSLIIPNVTGNYTSGGVTTSVRYATSQQGDLKYTTSTTDLAINGDGFFVVQDPSGKPFLTRAGSFVPDGDGRLVNAAGFYLMGYSAAERHAQRRHQRLRRSRARADLADRADGGAVQERPVHRQPAGRRGRRRARQPAFGECRNRHRLGEILAGRLRQSRLRGAARRLFHQDRRQHLGSRGLQPGQRRARNLIPLHAPVRLPRR